MTLENNAILHTAIDAAPHSLLRAALQWHLDEGMDELLAAEPVDRTQIAEQVMPQMDTAKPASPFAHAETAAPAAPAAKPLLGASQARAESKALAEKATTLEELREAIEGFDGLAIKNTASHLVFSDGNVDAPIMIIGEAPGADDDRQGKAFVGPSGQLLDQMLKWIGLDRHHEEAAKSVYLSNILNWRPPGNRTPTEGEIEVALPFIEKHIELAKPKILILCDGVAAKSLLQSDVSISRLRGKWHDYNGIPAIATYHPSYLLNTPAQKQKVWRDMLMVKEKIRELGL
jgi:uracil-DNA glycosylase family 4